MPSELVAPPGLVSGAYWVPGILGTLGLVMVNCISWEAVTGDGAFDDGVAAKAKCWVLFAMIFLFCSMGAAIWLFAADSQTANAYTWGGTAMLVQSLMIFASAILFRVSRRGGDHAI